MQLARNLNKINGFLKYSFSSQTQSYYQVLGVSNKASKQDILEAFYDKAQKIVPTVSTEGQDLTDLQGNQFRQVAEAYAVLSHEQSRTNYDLLNNQQPDSVFASHRAEQKAASERDFNGQTNSRKGKPGSYAAERQRVLAEERSKFNVNFLGRYNGGLPQRGKGPIRASVHGSALGIPGQHHDVLAHRIKANRDIDYQDVTNEIANDFSTYQQQSQYEVERRWPAFQAEVDYEYFKFNHYRIAWRYFRTIFFIFIGLPCVAQLLNRYRNAFALYQFESAVAADPTVKSVQSAGQKVIVGKTGTIRYAA